MDFKFYKISKALDDYSKIYDYLNEHQKGNQRFLSKIKIVNLFTKMEIRSFVQPRKTLHVHLVQNGLVPAHPHFVQARWLPAPVKSRVHHQALARLLVLAVAQLGLPLKGRPRLHTLLNEALQAPQCTGQTHTLDTLARQTGACGATRVPHATPQETTSDVMSHLSSQGSDCCRA